MAVLGSSSRSPIVLSDDEEAAKVPAAEPEQKPSADDEEILRPECLPDDFQMDVTTRRDGSLARIYTCPVGYRFEMLSDVIEYCSSGAFQRAVQAKATLADETTLQGKHQWFVGRLGWVLEIRAGGKNMSKMFKFYAHPHFKVRVASKEDAMHYINEGEIRPCANKEECDTNCEDNIIAQLVFYIRGLPPGWVQEIAFRKCNGGIRKDSFYTDPVSKMVYRSLKSAKQYFLSGVDADSMKPNQSITDMYFFDNCTDMLPCLAKRLKMEGAEDKKCEEVCQTSCTKGKKANSEKKRGKDAVTTSASKSPRPRGRPRKS